MIIKLIDWWKRRGKVRKYLRLVSYQEAELLLKDGWSLAPEEDDNHIGAMTRMVYLELLVDKRAAKNQAASQGVDVKNKKVIK